MKKLTFDELAPMVTEPPFHRWLGLRLVSVDIGKIVLELPWREEFVSDPKVRYTHGGIIAALIDIAADYAIAAEIGRGVPTIDMRVDFHKVAREGQSLRAEASVIKAGATLATAEAKVFGPDTSLLASGRGVYLTMQR